MITRLKISGFKSLENVDIQFGAFTCIAGANGAGKSNLFDAIRFLSALADNTLIGAAREIRYDGERSPDIRSLFSRYGDQYAKEMSFEVEMIVPAQGVDRLGQTADAATTFLKYNLILGYQESSHSVTQGGLHILQEELNYIKKTDAAKNILFPHSAKTWRTSVIQGKRTSPFISTEMNGDSDDQSSQQIIIKIHQDGNSGPTRKLLAATLPRTVLSEVNASESPTATVARFEMLSWRFLQLEPTALRRSDNYADPGELSPDGAHLPATLFHLSTEMGKSEGTGREAAQEKVYAEIANRLSELLDDVREVKVDQDDKRELLTLEVAGKDGAFHAARSLSDGTLRFIALSVLEAGSRGGVLCLEEPENGIHPARIEPMLQLLQDIAMDTDEAIDKDNPFRQVIINTHSPSVVNLVPDHCLLVADRKEVISDAGIRHTVSDFLPLDNTWRSKNETLPKGRLMTYLNPLEASVVKSPRTAKRVMDRPEYQQLNLDFGDS